MRRDNNPHSVNGNAWVDSLARAVAFTYVAEMRTVGVDLAADNAKTWVAVVEWEDDGARLVALDGGQSDDAVRAAWSESGVIGIDCPLGWPDDFVSFVVAHQTASNFVGSHDRDARRALAYRETDRVVLELFGGHVRPLSVATDKLGLVAVRCAGLLGALNTGGAAIDRSGASGDVVEVYPAASLRAWGLNDGPYKGPDRRAVLAEMVARLRSRTGAWLELADHVADLERSDDAFDSLIAALTARASRTGRTKHAPPDPRGEQSRFDREGWIHVPAENSLDLLRFEPE